eukprot:scaffold27185_cov97-Isochrysis_galbana.AAC.4
MPSAYAASAAAAARTPPARASTRAADRPRHSDRLATAVHPLSPMRWRVLPHATQTQLPRVGATAPARCTGRWQAEPPAAGALAGAAHCLA